VNTLALRARDRTDNVDRKDLNRLFPGKKDGTVTERIAYHFFNKFVKKATFGIDLHTGMKGHLLVPHPRVRVFNNSSPSLEYPQALGTEIIFYNEGKEGMLNIQAEKAGIPIVCFEIGEAGRLDEYYINEGFKGVMNFMKYFGMIDGAPEIPEKQILLKDYMELPSRISGLFHPRASAGDVVKKNQLVGIVSSPFYNESRRRGHNRHQDAAHRPSRHNRRMVHDIRPGRNTSEFEEKEGERENIPDVLNGAEERDGSGSRFQTIGTFLLV